MIRFLFLALALLLAADTAWADPPRRYTAASPVVTPETRKLRTGHPPAPANVPRPSGQQPWTGSTVRFGDGYRPVDPLGRRLEGQGRGWELSPDGSQWRGTGTNFGRSCPAPLPGGSVTCY